MLKANYVLHYLVILMGIFSIVIGVREYKKEDILRLREEVREMFQHAYDSYLRYAYPYDELRPLSCDGVDTWGSYSLTLIDALDTLAIMGNYSEFNRVVDIVLKRESFDADINVSVFETNIRIVGGLLSAHLLSHKTGIELEPGWPCNGPLLRLAEDAAHRLIAAFDTTTGMPYGTINLRNGVPPGETTVTCTAGVGTFIVEFGTLSRLTGDPLYEEVAYNALKALYHHKSPIGLFGNHIDVMSGKWTAQDSGIGGGVDSYFEYLVKGAILLEKPELMSMFKEAKISIDQYLKREDWYVWASMMKGLATMPIFQSLEAFWPGILSLIGDTDTAMRVILNYHSVWRQYGFTPEVYNLGAAEASSNRESYPLRPELIESIMILYSQTKDPILLQMGEDILRSIQHSSKTECGYATIKDVRDHRKDDRMESFFLAETTKYLYLLFDPDNFIHNSGVRGKVINTPNGECIVDVGGYIFNTEAHPIDPTMLHCCHEARNGINMSEVHEMYKLLEEQDNIKLTLRHNNIINMTGDYQIINATEVQTDNTQNNTLKNVSTKDINQKTKESKEPDDTHKNTKNNEEGVSANKDSSLTNNQNEVATHKLDEDVDDYLEEVNLVNDEDVDKYLDKIKREMDEMEKNNKVYKNVDNVLCEVKNVKDDKNEDLIKTETKTGYVNIDGRDRDEVKAHTSTDGKDIFNNLVDAVQSTIESWNSETKNEEENKSDEFKSECVDDIVVAEKPSKKVTPRGPTRAKPLIKILPNVIQELLNKDWNAKPKCEPQYMLERIRKEKRHPDHPHMHKYELLLTPAPHFLQRISLAGEFCSRKSLK